MRGNDYESTFSSGHWIILIDAGADTFRQELEGQNACTQNNNVANKGDVVSGLSCDL